MLGNKYTSGLLGNIDYLMHSNDRLMNNYLIPSIVGGVLIPSQKLIKYSKKLK